MPYRSVMEKLQYGLLDGKLVHIDDVEKGKDCECLCPHCKAQLVAKKGERRVKHFAHYTLAECDHGTETALHLMAKNIVAETCTLFVPFVPKTEYDLAGNGRVMTFERAEQEKQLSSNIRGDVVLYNGNSFLNVEIKVTHEVDKQKAIDLFNLGVPTIEVDLSDLKSSFTPEMVKQRLIDGKKTSLIYSPKCKAVFAKWLLGEWKTVRGSSSYVHDCPLTRSKTYFLGVNSPGSRNECHECDAFFHYNGGEKLLCYGCVDGIDFSKIDKIEHLVKEENHLREVKLLMQDGSVIERSLKQR